MLMILFFFFFCKDQVHNIVTTKSLLRCFETVSWLKVNLHKSSLGGIGVESTNLQRYAAMLNCKIMEIPFKYFGVSIGGSHNRVTF